MIERQDLIRKIAERQTEDSFALTKKFDADEFRQEPELFVGNTRNEYTPTTIEILDAYRSARFNERGIRLNRSSFEFDRWLAEVKAQAWDEGYLHCFECATNDEVVSLKDNPYREAEQIRIMGLFEALLEETLECMCPVCNKLIDVVALIKGEES